MEVLGNKGLMTRSLLLCSSDGPLALEMGTRARITQIGYFWAQFLDQQYVIILNVMMKTKISSSLILNRMNCQSTSFYAFYAFYSFNSAQLFCYHSFFSHSIFHPFFFPPVSFFFPIPFPFLPFLSVLFHWKDSGWIPWINFDYSSSENERVYTRVMVWNCLQKKKKRTLAFPSFHPDLGQLRLLCLTQRK